MWTDRKCQKRSKCSVLECVWNADEMFYPTVTNAIGLIKKMIQWFSKNCRLSHWRQVNEMVQNQICCAILDVYKKQNKIKRFRNGRKIPSHLSAQQSDKHRSKVRSQTVSWVEWIGLLFYRLSSPKTELTTSGDAFHSSLAGTRFHFNITEWAGTAFDVYLAGTLWVI